MNMDEKLNTVIRVRSSNGLKGRLKSLARTKSLPGHRKVNYSDLAREALNEYLDREERRRKVAA